MPYKIINTISYSRGINIGLILFGCVIAPLMFIFQFFRSTFDSNGWVPLILLACVISAPLLIILSALWILDMSVFDPEDHTEIPEYRIGQIAATSRMLAFYFYAPCLVRFLYPALSTQQAALCILALILPSIVYSFISISTDKMRKIKETLEREAASKNQ